MRRSGSSRESARRRRRAAARRRLRALVVVRLQRGLRRPGRAAAAAQLTPKRARRALAGANGREVGGGERRVIEIAEFGEAVQRLFDGGWRVFDGEPLPQFVARARAAGDQPQPAADGAADAGGRSRPRTACRGIDRHRVASLS